MEIYFILKYIFYQKKKNKIKLIYNINNIYIYINLKNNL